MLGSRSVWETVRLFAEFWYNLAHGHGIRANHISRYVHTTARMGLNGGGEALRKKAWPHLSLSSLAF